MTNVLDEVGSVPVAAEKELSVFLVNRDGRKWVVMDSTGTDGVVNAVCVKAKDTPKLIALLQKAFRSHCSIESHTPYA